MLQRVRLLSAWEAGDYRLAAAACACDRPSRIQPAAAPTNRPTANALAVGPAAPRAAAGDAGAGDAASA